MRNAATLAALTVAVFFSAGLRSAQAYWPCYPGLLGPAYQWNVYTREHVPYFITNPPIYYSYSILKGVDPWYPFRPAPVYVYEAPRPAPQPKLIVNPYVQQPVSQPAEPVAPGKLSQAMRIKNPFVLP